MGKSIWEKFGAALKSIFTGTTYGRALNTDNDTYENIKKVSQNICSKVPPEKGFEKPTYTGTIQLLKGLCALGSKD